jgi:hypothetical protein
MEGCCFILILEKILHDSFKIYIKKYRLYSYTSMYSCMS